MSTMHANDLHHLCGRLAHHVLTARKRLRLDRRVDPTVSVALDSVVQTRHAVAGEFLVPIHPTYWRQQL